MLGDLKLNVLSSGGQTHTIADGQNALGASQRCPIPLACNQPRPVQLGGPWVPGRDPVCDLCFEAALQASHLVQGSLPALRGVCISMA